MKIGNIEFSKELVSFMKENKGLIKTMLENNETREVDYTQDNLFSILNSFFETNNDALITIDNETDDNYDESEVLGAFGENKLVALSTNRIKIYLIKVNNKLAIIGEELISAIPWLDC